MVSTRTQDTPVKATAMTTDLEDLLARIEAAKRFSRGLDREIGLALGGWELRGDLIADHEGNTYVDHPGGMYPSPTEELHVALAMADRLFPGHGRVLTRMPCQGGFTNTMTIIAMPADEEASAIDPAGWGVHYAGKGATEALAACAAVAARAIGVPRR